MKANDLFDRDEIRRLTTPSDLRGLGSVALTWGLIAAIFAVVAAYPSVITVGGALVLLAGRQLALAVLAHECAHRSLFRSPALNKTLGKWLCGSPVWVDVERYRIQHIGHHAHAGTENDPDRGLASGFPIAPASFRRKVWRDLSGQTGVKRVIALFMVDLGLLAYTMADRSDRLERTPFAFAKLGTYARRFVVYTGPVLVSNAAIAVALGAAGAGWAYVLWPATYLTTYSLVIRIRSIAEHACTDENEPSPLKNTRTTLASPFERLILAPHHVNYHTEHHLLPTAPHYRLPQMHRLLVERNAFAIGHLATGYREVLARAVRVP